jgi:hypothetical protein
MKDQPVAAPLLSPVPKRPQWLVACPDRGPIRLSGLTADLNTGAGQAFDPFNPALSSSIE